MPTSSYFGRNSFIGAAQESGWGTRNFTSTVSRPIISCSMMRQLEKVERANLRVAGVAGLRQGHYLASDKVTGSLELEATYDNLGYFLDAALGSSASSSADGDGIRTHTYSMGDVPVAGTTLRLQRGTSTYNETFTGVVFNNLTMSCAAGEAMTMSLEMIGKTSLDDEGPRGDTTLTMTDPSKENLVLHHHAGTLGWNSQNFELIDFEYKLENGIAERLRLGSLTTKQPVQSDFRNATITVSFETDDIQGYKAFLDDVVGDLSIVFNNDGAAGNLRTMTFNLNKCYIETYTDEISEVGLVTASVTFKAQGDGGAGTDMGTQVIVKNEAATAVHNG